jgi:hypothetical protein
MKNCTCCSCIKKKADFYRLQDDSNVNEYNDETDGLLYGLEKVQDIISSDFKMQRI